MQTQNQAQSEPLSVDSIKEAIKKEVYCYPDVTIAVRYLQKSKKFLVKISCIEAEEIEKIEKIEELEAMLQDFHDCMLWSDPSNI